MSKLLYIKKSYKIKRQIKKTKVFAEMILDILNILKLYT